MFCVDKQHSLSYRAVERLRRYMGETAKVESSRKTGNCLKHQRMLRRAILRARHVALLPLAPTHNRVTGPVAVQEAPPPPPATPEDGEAAKAEDQADGAPVAADAEAPTDAPEDSGEVADEETDADAPEDSDEEADEETDADAPEDSDEDSDEEADESASGESDEELPADEEKSS